MMSRKPNSHGVWMQEIENLTDVKKIVEYFLKNRDELEKSDIAILYDYDRTLTEKDAKNPKGEVVLRDGQDARDMITKFYHDGVQQFIITAGANTLSGITGFLNELNGTLKLGNIFHPQNEKDKDAPLGLGRVFRKGNVISSQDKNIAMDYIMWRLLDEKRISPKLIIFVDDSPSNILNMNSHFKKDTPGNAEAVSLRIKPTTRGFTTEGVDDNPTQLEEIRSHEPKIPYSQGFDCYCDSCIQGKNKICDCNDEKGGVDKDLSQLSDGGPEENSESEEDGNEPYFNQNLSELVRLQNVEKILQYIYTNIGSISSSNVVPLVPNQHPEEIREFLTKFVLEFKKNPAKYALILRNYQMGIPAQALEKILQRDYSDWQETKEDWQETKEDWQKLVDKNVTKDAKQILKEKEKERKRKLDAAHQMEVQQSLITRAVNPFSKRLKKEGKTMMPPSPNPIEAIESFTLEAHQCDICKSRKYYTRNKDNCVEKCGTKIADALGKNYTDMDFTTKGGDNWFWPSDPYPFIKKTRTRHAPHRL